MEPTPTPTGRRTGLWGEAIAPPCCHGCRHLFNDSNWESPNQGDYCGRWIFFPYRKGSCAARQPREKNRKPK